jgi:uncharacterized membrane protein
VEQMSVRVRAWWDDLRDSLWVLPTVTVLASFLAASGLVASQPHVPERLDGFTFGGSPEGARAVLSELAGATFTVTGVVFSLTIVALQMASSQFTPRLLRTFLRDRRTQLVLSGMLGSGVFDVAVLRQVRSSGEGSDSGFVPELAVSAALLYAFVAVGLLVFFLHHLTRHMRVDVIMADIRRQTLGQLRAVERERDVLPDQHGAEPGPHSLPVPAKLGGYLQTVDVEVLARTASRHDVVVRLRPTMGDWVSAGTTLAWVWHDDDRPITVDRKALASEIHSALHLGPDRTESADLAFGLRQLADIAVRALSPGVNDPTTAVQALGQLAAVLVELAKHPLGADQAVGDDGVVRAIAPRADLAGHLELAIDQIRRYGRDEPAVLVAIAVLLTDLAEHVADDADRQEVVRDQLRRTRRAVDVEDPDASRRVTRALDEAERTLELGARPPGQIEAG